MTSLQNDSQHALEILERIQDKLRDSSDLSSHEDDLDNLIYMLESPLFSQILNLEESIIQLKQIQAIRPLGTDDFDFNPSTGELILQGPNVQDLESSGSEVTPANDLPDRSNTLGPDPVSLSLDKSRFASDAKFVKAIENEARNRRVETITLQKVENMSLGFSVVGLKSEYRGDLGIFIQKIQPGGLAHRDGQLQENDQILAIEGEVLETTISHPQAIQLLQQASGRVELVVARSPDPQPLPQTPTAPVVPSVAPPQPVSPLLASEAPVALDRTPSAVSDTSDMVLSTEWTQLEVIDLLNDGSGLGFGIIGGKSTGVVVKTILPGGVADRDGRLRSGDHILQIGDVNVRGMGSEQVATVLRQSGAHVRLIVARGVVEPTDEAPPHAPVIPTHQLDEHLHNLNEYVVAMSQGRMLMEDDDEENMADMPEYMAQMQQEAMEAQAGLPEGASLGLLSSDEDHFEVELLKDTQGLGITIAGYVGDKTADELSGIFVRSITEGSAAALDGRIQLNDQIIAVDNQPLEGFSNQQAVEVLRNTGHVVRLKLARYKHGPKYDQLQQYIRQTEESQQAVDSANSSTVSVEDVNVQHAGGVYSGELSPEMESAIKAQWRAIVGEGYEIIVAQLAKFKEGGGLGISLEGTVDVEYGVEKHPHHYIRSVLDEGPVGLNRRLIGGDELLEVNDTRLLGLNHKDVVKVLKDLPQHVRIVCARRINAQTLPSSPEASPSAIPSVKSATEPAYAQTYPQLFQSPVQSPEAQYGALGAPLSPTSERLVKAKSDQDLPASTYSPPDPSLNRMKSRSLEPLAGFAMWSSAPTVIELQKGDRGLGFSILDYQDPINPSETVIVIRSLVPGGIAQLDGRLIPGDRLIFVNDANLENATLDQAVQALKGAPKGIVHIGVYKPLPLPEIGESSTDDFGEDLNDTAAVGETTPAILPTRTSAFTPLHSAPHMSKPPPQLPNISPPHSPPPPAPYADNVLPSYIESVTMETDKHPAIPGPDSSSYVETEEEGESTEEKTIHGRDWLEMKAKAADERIERLLSQSADSAPDFGISSKRSLDLGFKELSSPTSSVGPSLEPSPAYKKPYLDDTAADRHSSFSSSSSEEGSDTAGGRRVLPVRVASLQTAPVSPPIPDSKPPGDPTYSPNLSPLPHVDSSFSPSLYKLVMTKMGSPGSDTSHSSSGLTSPTRLASLDSLHTKLYTASKSPENDDADSPATSPIHTTDGKLYTATKKTDGSSSPISIDVSSPTSSQSLSSPPKFVAATPPRMGLSFSPYRMKPSASSPPVSPKTESVRSEHSSSSSSSFQGSGSPSLSPPLKSRPVVPPKPKSAEKPKPGPKPDFQEFDAPPSRAPPAPPEPLPLYANLNKVVPMEVEQEPARADSPPPYIPPAPVAAAASVTSSDLKSMSSATSTPVMTSPHTLSPVPSPTTSPRSPASPFGLDAIGMLPASAERTIKIKKGNDHLGLTVETVDKGLNGCVVKNISPQGAVGKDSRIRVGDYIVSVNNETMRKITNAQARAILRRAQLLGTDISITYIPSSEAASYRDNTLISVKDQGPTPHSQLSPNSSLTSPSSQSSTQSTPGSIDGGRSAPANFLQYNISESIAQRLGDLPTSPPPEYSSVEAPLYRSPSSPPVYANVVARAGVLASSPTSSSSPPLSDGSNLPESIANQSISVPLPSKPRETWSVDSSWGSSRTVNIHRREGENLGINIIGGRIDLFHMSTETQRAISGIFIKHVSSSSPAGKDGLLKKGDRILEVDDSDLRNATHDQAVAAIKKADNPVRFLIQSLIEPSWASQELDITTPGTNVLSTQEQPKPAENGTSNGLRQVIWSQDSNTEIPRDIMFEEEEEDDYGYTRKRLLKKYGDLGGQLHMVEVERHGNNGLGLSLAGNRDLGTMSVFVVGIQPETPVAHDGRIRVGDELLEINGQTLYGRCHLNASAIIKGISTHTVKIILLRKEDYLTHMAVKPLRLPPVEHKDDPSTLIPKKPRLQGSIGSKDSKDDFNSEDMTEADDNSEVMDISVTEENQVSETSPPSSTPPPPLASLPAPEQSWPGFSDVKHVVLEKAAHGLGFAIQEGSLSGDCKTGIFVKAVTPGGAAARESQLKVNDRILQVEDQNLVESSYEKAIDMLRKVPRGTVTLTFTQTPASSTSAEADKPVLSNGTQHSASDSARPGGKAVSPASPRSPSPVPPETPPVEDPATIAINPGQETVIEIQKGKSGLGLSIVGGADTVLGTIIVHEVYEDGAASNDGRLWAGDQILEVNNLDLRNSTHDRAINVLRQTPAVVRMVVFRDESLLKDEDLYEVFTVELLKKPGKGLGLTIVGKRKEAGIYISDIVKGGVAEADGRLSQGDQILNVNGEDFKGATQEKAAGLLKTLTGKVIMTVGRLKTGSGTSSRRSSSQSGHSGVVLKKSDSSVSTRSKGKHCKSGSTLELETCTVEIDRDSAGCLGLSITGGVGNPLGDMPIMIADLNPSGPAAQSGKLQTGDIVCSINGESATNMTQLDAVECLKSVEGTVILEIAHGDKVVIGDNPLSPLEVTLQLDQPSVFVEPCLSDSQTGFQGKIQKIVLEKGHEGLGFSIVGGHGSQHGDLPVYVKTVYNTGAAAKDGHLKRGDQILAVHNKSLEGVTHAEAVTILTQSPGRVELTVLS